MSSSPLINRRSFLRIGAAATAGAAATCVGSNAARSQETRTAVIAFAVKHSLGPITDLKAANAFYADLRNVTGRLQGNPNGPAARVQLKDHLNAAENVRQLSVALLGKSNEVYSDPATAKALKGLLDVLEAIAR